MTGFSLPVAPPFQGQAAMKERDIRPDNMMERLFEINRRDLERFLPDKSQLMEIPCPACGSERRTAAFDKFGFSYVSCRECDTLYLSPRPTPEMMAWFYENAESVKFWWKEFYPRTLEARRKKMFAPRAKLVEYWADHFNLPRSGVVADIGAGCGIFLEELAKTNRFRKTVGIEPSIEMARICREKGFDVIQKKMEDVEEGQGDMIFATAFEVLEHLLNPSRFLRAVKRMLCPGGLFLFTTLSSNGFDIQVLWEKSNSVYPPHHINLISFEGMKQIMQRCGFDLVDLQTPGELDVDIVRNATLVDDGPGLSRFERSIVVSSTPELRTRLQDFLRASNLSSHIRGIARKGGTC